MNQNEEQNACLISRADISRIVQSHQGCCHRNGGAMALSASPLMAEEDEQGGISCPQVSQGTKTDRDLERKRKRRRAWERFGRGGDRRREISLFLHLKAFPPRCVGKSQTHVKLTLIQNSTPNIITYIIYKAGSEKEVKSNFE